jgi:2-polyprenyl-3-methyl-5-hydroxy-6-metoxy-1,4-benzoquinol methylase
LDKKNFLRESASWYSSSEGFMRDWGEFHKRWMAYCFATVSRWMRGDNCLEFGPADGESTQYLLPCFPRVVAVEGADNFVDQVRQRFREQVEAGQLILHHSLFEEFWTEEKFDAIFANHILEHLSEPVGFLRYASQFLKPDGVLVVIVPNAQSLHRLVGVKMGLLDVPHSLSPQDLRLGHQRVYYPQELYNDIYKSNLQIVEHGGIFLKPLSNKQIQDTWDEQLMDGYYELGKDFPEHTSEIYAVCKTR